MNNRVQHVVSCSRYVDISDSIYPDRYPVLIKEQQLVKVRHTLLCEVTTAATAAALLCQPLEQEQ